MELEEAFFDLIDSLAGTQVYALVAPDNTTGDYLVYQRISTDHRHTLAGGAGSAVARVQVVSWSDTFAGALALAETVRQACQGYRGDRTVGEETMTICIIMEDSGDMPELEPGNRGGRKYGRRQDYVVTWPESKPA